MTDKGMAYTNLVGVASVGSKGDIRVIASDPDHSYIVRKLEAGPSIVGQQMPLGKAPISAANMQLIRDWIADGAKNN